MIDPSISIKKTGSIKDLIKSINVDIKITTEDGDVEEYSGELVA